MSHSGDYVEKRDVSGSLVGGVGVNPYDYGGQPVNDGPAGVVASDSIFQIHQCFSSDSLDDVKSIGSGRLLGKAAWLQGRQRYWRERYR